MSYSVLATLLISLIIYWDSIKNGLNVRLFSIATIIFLISSSLFNFRAATNFTPVIGLILIFANKINLKKKIIYSLAVLISFFLVFYFIPLKVIQIPLDKFFPTISLTTYLNPIKIKYFFQTISSFFFLDLFQHPRGVTTQQIEGIKTILGLIISLGFIAYSFIHKQERDLTRLRIFSVVWIMGMFAPYLLRNDFALNSTHRYILWIYPGILLAWSTLYKHRLWIPITLFFLIIQVVGVNSFYNTYLSKSQERASFYNQLHTLLPNVLEGSVLYFDFQPKIRIQADDFFRVGFTPPESAIGAEYRVDYTKITLVTKSDDLERVLSKPDFLPNSFYSFYYDGKLSNTTDLSRTLLLNSRSQDKKGVMKYLNQSTFKLENYIPVIPTKLKIQLTSSQIPFTLPFEVKCDACTPLEEGKQLQQIFNFLQSQPDMVDLKISDFGENSTVDYIIDNSINTYWIGDRNL